MSKYSPQDKHSYFYPDTEILKNKENIRDQAKLTERESELYLIASFDLKQSPYSIQIE